MTSSAVESPVLQQIDLLARLRSVLDAHPAGSAFHLVYAAHTVEVAPDEVLVQVANPDRGVLELHPVPLDELSREHVLHDTQVVDPAAPAETLAGWECVARRHNTVPARRGHLYVS